MSAGWFVVIGAAIGIVGSLGASWLTESRLDRRAERQREAKRELQRATLQRETLIALQDALLRVVRTGTQVALFDDAHPAGSLLPEDLNQESMLAFQDVNKLVERVLDDEVRALVNETTSAASRIGLRAWPTEQSSREMADAYMRATARIGVVLRATI